MLNNGEVRRRAGRGGRPVTTTDQSKLAWAFQLLPADDQLCLLSLLKRAKFLQVQMFWHSTSFYKHHKGPWQCSYKPRRTASMTFYNWHACPLSFPHFAAVGLATRQKNTSSSTAAIFWLQGTL
jgi:hypothetical protein